MSFDPYTIHYHARQDDNFRVEISANPGTESAPNEAYYTMRIGDGLVFFLDEENAVAIMSAINSRPPLPKPEPECECRMTGDMADASECEVHRG